MTRDQDIERVLDRWLTEGPTQMPSRFLDDTLDRIDRVPQRRLARLRTRLPAMNPYLRFAAAAAVVVAAAGLGAAVLTQTMGVGTTPTAGSGLLPTSGHVEWHPVGTRRHPTLSGDTIALDLDIVIEPTAITIFEFHGDVINSASLVGAGRLDLRQVNRPMVSVPEGGAVVLRPYWQCQIGDAGTYTYRLSSGDRLLTLTPVSDACADRATILTGDWTRTDIGNLSPGRRVSPIFRPFTGGTSGQLSYTVPTGWAVRNEYDELETSLRLGKTGPCQPLPRTDCGASAPDGPTIRLFSSVMPRAADAACSISGAVVDPTPLAFAQWLMTVPGLDVTSPTAVTIGGLNGVMVDLSTLPGWTNRCDGSGVHTFIESVQPAYQDAPLAVAGAKRARYYLLDAGPGLVLLVAVEAPDKATWDAALVDVTAIVQSFAFAR